MRYRVPFFLVFFIFSHERENLVLTLKMSACMLVLVDNPHPAPPPQTTSEAQVGSGDIFKMPVAALLEYLYL